MASIERFTIDPKTSTVTIAARSSVHPITVVVAPTGWIEVRRTGGVPIPVAGRIEVAAARLRSGNPLIDRETRRRIDARRHPTIAGELTELVEVEGATATVEGTIDFIGESVLVEGVIELAPADGGLRVTGSGVLDVRWWGLEPPKLLTLRVHPEVEVTVDLVATNG